jgi:hypothetical protein
MNGVSPNCDVPFTVTAYDLESGIKSVTLRWTDAAGSPHSANMSLAPGSARLYQVTVNMPGGFTYTPYARAVNGAGRGTNTAKISVPPHC